MGDAAAECVDADAVVDGGLLQGEPFGRGLVPGGKGGIGGHGEFLSGSVG